jgi:ribonuclease P protein component
MKKQYRVKKSEEIEKIIKEKNYKSNPYLTLYNRNNTETGHLRYAIRVGKKIGNAVERNRIKRHITAVIDNMSIDLDSSTDVFIIARVQIKELSYGEIKKQLEYLFRKQKLIKGEKNG